MSSKVNLNSSENENMCVVCFKNVSIYSIGICDHPVCFECSTRMRVLCRQNECPICRQDMPKVVFTNRVEPFRNLKTQYGSSQLFDRRFGIAFQNLEIQRQYYGLLEHNCDKCNKCGPFRNFNQLKEHMRREHELHYCDLCVANLRIFTWERRCYTRFELAQHRRKGDLDNKSHKGHPLCEFCDTRYMDSDELFRHLRRDHLFCHFCDADGKHQYYNTYEALRQHFQSEHFLCEEGECVHEKFTSVFRTEIDLRAHRASVHSKHLGKAATKQARTLELEFTLAPRPRPEQPPNRKAGKLQPSSNGNSNSNQNQNERLQEEGAVGYEPYYTEPGGGSGGGNGSGGGITLTAQDFPSLGGGGGTSAPSTGGNVTIRHVTRGQNALARTNQNFPALSGDSGTVRFSVNSSTVSPQERVQSATSSAPNVSIHVNHRPNGAITTHISHQQNQNSTNSVRIRPKSEAFPALGSVQVPEAQWVKNTPKEPKPKVSKVTPAPVLPVRESTSDFPSLSGKSEPKPKKSSSVTVPISNKPNSVVTTSNKTTSINVSAGSKTSSVLPTSNKTSSVVPTSNKTSSVNVTAGNKSSSVTVPVSNCWASEPENKDKAKNKKKKKNSSNGSNNNSGNESNGNKPTSASDSKPNSKPDKSENKYPSKTEKVEHKPDSKSENKSESKSERSTKKDKEKPTINGIVKKRSELTIESLHINDPSTSNGHEEFPPLGASGAKPPPGFSIQPPPGFAANDLTFTNSSGQSYAILPCQSFSPPPNFNMRNKKLVENFMTSLESNDAIQEFKDLSGMFRNGLFAADQYYEHCKQVMKKDFSRIFPELLVLLPDIQKQQELFAIHCKSDAQNKKGLEVCATCRQVVSSHDLRSHLGTHSLDNNFPVLAAHADLTNVWRK